MKQLRVRIAQYRTKMLSSSIRNPFLGSAFSLTRGMKSSKGKAFNAFMMDHQACIQMQAFTATRRYK